MFEFAMRHPRTVFELLKLSISTVKFIFNFAFKLVEFGFATIFKVIDISGYLIKGMFKATCNVGGSIAQFASNLSFPNPLNMIKAIDFSPSEMLQSGGDVFNNVASSVPDLSSLSTIELPNIDLLENLSSLTLNINFDAIFNLISSIDFSLLIQIIQQAAQKIPEIIENIDISKYFSNIGDWISNLSVSNMNLDFSLLTQFKETLAKFLSSASESGSGLIESAQGMGSGLIEGAKGMGSGLMEGAQGMGSGLVEGAKDIGSSAGELFSGAGELLVVLENLLKVLENLLKVLEKFYLLYGQYLRVWCVFSRM